MERIREWLSEWGSLVVLGVFVVVLVLVAYSQSPDWAVTPLDGVSTIGSLLLSVFLLYIYHRQNEILEKQQEIMESEKQLKTVSEISPKLHYEWTLKEDGHLGLQLENSGADDAYNLTIHSHAEITTDVSSLETEPWSKKFKERLPLNETYTKKLFIRYRLGMNGDIDEVGFRRFSRAAVRAVKEETESDDITVDLSLWLSYEDQRGNSEEKNIIDTTLTLEGDTKMYSKRDGSIELNTILPSINITDAGVFRNPVTNEDNYGIEYEPSGDSVVYDLSVASEIRILSDSKWISSKDFFTTDDDFRITGCDLEADDRRQHITGKLRFSVSKGKETENCSFFDMSDRLLKQGFDKPLLINLQVFYRDPSLNPGQDRTVNLAEVVVTDDASREYDTGEIVLITEPMHLYEVEGVSG